MVEKVTKIESLSFWAYTFVVEYTAIYTWT